MHARHLDSLPLALNARAAARRRSASTAGGQSSSSGYVAKTSIRCCSSVRLFLPGVPIADAFARIDPALIDPALIEGVDRGVGGPVSGMAACRPWGDRRAAT